MLFISVEDFLLQAEAIPKLTPEQEQTLAEQMATGDPAARGELIRGYLPVAAAFVRRAPRQIQTLRTVYACVAAVETGVDRFDFSGREKFVNHLCWRLRQCITRCLADQP